MQSDPIVSDPRPFTTRSAVSNKRRHFDNLDGRTAEARRFKDLVEAFAADLGPGGLTQVGHLLIRNAAILVVRLEQAQGAVLRGEAVDPGALTHLADVTAAALERLPSAGP